MRIENVKGAEILYSVADELADSTHYVRLDEVDSTVIYVGFPYKDPQLQMSYGDDLFLEQTKVVWENEALDRGHPTATVIVKGNEVISSAGNGKFYEEPKDCERKKLGVATGTRYDLCDHNHDFPYHSEAKASRVVIEKDLNPDESPLTAYLYGHWWCCEPCCEAMKKAGVTKVVMSKKWTRQFLEI